jgi:hypothetical protein
MRQILVDGELADCKDQSVTQHYDGGKVSLSDNELVGELAGCAIQAIDCVV